MQKQKPRTSQRKKGAAILILGVLLNLMIFQTANAGLLQDIGKPIAGAAKGVSDFLGLGDLGGGSTTTTSFTNFKGGLEAPSTTGYSAGLTKATDARTYILNVTNFFLGFLGLTAVIIVIYGGILYVTAAGKEEQATKGKKSITYAIIGLIIIMGSFALVNTILQAPSGTDATKGAAESGGVSGGTVQRRFNVLASRVQTMAKNIVTAFAFHFDAKKDLADVKSILDESVKTAIANDAALCRQNWEGLSNCLNDIKAQIDNAVAKLEAIKGYLPSTTIDSIVIKSSIDDVIAYLNNQFWSKGYAAAVDEANSTGNGCGPESGKLVACNTPDLQAVFGKFDQATKHDADLFAGSITDPNPAGLFVKAQKAVLGNFNSTINASKNDLNDMYHLIGPITTVADDAFAKLVALDFLKKDQALATRNDLEHAAGGLEDLEASVTSFSDNTPATDSAPFTKLYDILSNFTTLYSLLKDILFVDSRITASVAEGNAPLVVNFSSVGSLDPSGITVQDSQIEWDLDGNGKSNAGGLTGKFGSCNEEAKAAVSCTYNEPGTYRVALRIKPTDQPDTATGKKFSEEIGAGIATVVIKVNPPVIKINLKATVGTTTFPLRTFDSKSGRLINDVNILKVTTSEAAAGIKFDATETDQVKNKIAKVRWNFGDIAPEVIGDTTELTQLVKYPKAGTYKVELELTDTLNNVDRKIVNVIVGSPLARIIVTPGTEGNVGDEFSFDGGDSASDGGQIKSYQWTYGTEAPVEAPTYKKIFSEPGPQKLSLTVTDNLDKTDTTSVDLNVTSKAPVAQFTSKFPDAKQPGTVYLDGTKSYDPDNSKAALTYQWEIDGQKTATGDGFSYLNATTPTSPKPVVAFTKTGTHAVTLVVTDPNGFGAGKPQDSEAAEKDLDVTDVLDIAWNTTDTTSGIMAQDPTTKENFAAITMTLLSTNAVAYEINFGDGEKENGDMSATKPVTHKYKQAGTYTVKASVFDAADKENTISRKVFIGSSTTPVAQITIKVNGNELADTTAPPPIEVNRKDVISFDASKSKNTDGTGRRLNYSWDFGDGQKSTTEQSNHTYKELGDYTISLKAVNANDVSQTATDTVQLKVMGEVPTLRSITAIPAGSSLVTPVAMQLDAIGAEDIDGKVVRYHWWFYDPSNDTDKLGDQITTNPTATINIGTRGDEGQQKTYQFAVELTDDENNTVSSKDILDSKMWPEVTVTNGPNKAPVAKFNVDRSSIMVGESVNFSSASTDADGTIAHYYWDWEGDGFANNTKDEGSNVSHTFDKPAKDGVRVKLKVVDNNESEATSDPVTIYVDSKAQPPVAAFTSAQDSATKNVKFTSTSTADTASGVNLAKYSWDFDVKVDADGDGKLNNDSESTEQNPSHAYPDMGLYRAKLTVTDSDGQPSSVENLVYLKAAAPAPAPAPAPGATPTPKPAAPTLDARMLTTPAPSFVDSKVHLKGESGDVTFDFSTSTGNIKTYIIDKNTYFDTNGNGIKDDDEDYKATAPGSWTSNFAKSFGQIRVRLTVVDDTGKKDTVDKDIVFDATAGSTFTANVFGAADPGIAAALVTAAGFVILNLKLSRGAKQNARNTKQK